MVDETPIPFEFLDVQAFPPQYERAGTLRVLGQDGLLGTGWRAFWFTGARPDEVHGGHAHRRTTQIFVALQGRARITVHDGTGRTSADLVSGGRAIALPPMRWAELDQWSPAAIVLVLADQPYDEADYIRDREEFERERSTARPVQ